MVVRQSPQKPVGRTADLDGRVQHNSAPDQSRGVAGNQQHWLHGPGQLPDVCIELNNLIAEGNRVVARGAVLSGGTRGRFTEVFQIIDVRITDAWNILTFHCGWVEDGAALWPQR